VSQSDWTVSVKTLQRGLVKFRASYFLIESDFLISNKFAKINRLALPNQPGMRLRNRYAKIHSPIESKSSVELDGMKFSKTR